MIGEAFAFVIGILMLRYLMMMTGIFSFSIAFMIFIWPFSNYLEVSIPTI